MEESDPSSVKLAKAASQTNWDALPTTVQTKTRELLLDTLSVIAGAAKHPEVQALAHQISPQNGATTLISEKRGAATREAILLNAATTTVLQRQDGYAHAKGHPASQLVPVLLGLAEREGSDARAMLTAMVAGYEVGARVGGALGGVPPWLHDNGNWTTVGIAAGAAHLLSHGDAMVIGTAIEGASSLALSFDRFTTAAGATIHHLYPAMATTHALAIAEGAMSGLTALPGSLERFYGPRLGADFEAMRLHDGINKSGWTQYEILNSYFKLHPSCAHLHGVNDAVDALIAEYNITEVDIEAIDVATFGEAVEIDSPNPSNDLAARFSAKATVAAAIRYGELHDDGLLDLEVLAPLMDKISVRHDPALDKHTPEGRPGIVTVTLNNARILHKAVIHPRGTPKVNATENERFAKAISLLERHYGSANEKTSVEDIVSAAMMLGKKGSLNDLTAALREQQV